jgi:hypothetical protein
MSSPDKNHRQAGLSLFDRVATLRLAGFYAEIIQGLPLLVENPLLI